MCCNGLQERLPQLFLPFVFTYDQFKVEFPYLATKAGIMPVLTKSCSDDQLYVLSDRLIQMNGGQFVPFQNSCQLKRYLVVDNVHASREIAYTTIIRTV